MKQRIRREESMASVAKRDTVIKIVAGRKLRPSVEVRTMESLSWWMELLMATLATPFVAGSNDLAEFNVFGLKLYFHFFTHSIVSKTKLICFMQSGQCNHLKAWKLPNFVLYMILNGFTTNRLSSPEWLQDRQLNCWLIGTVRFVCSLRRCIWGKPFRLRYRLHSLGQDVHCTWY